MSELPRQDGAVRHAWPTNGRVTYCGLAVITALKIRNGGAERLCKRCRRAKARRLP